METHSLHSLSAFTVESYRKSSALHSKQIVWKLLSRLCCVGSWTEFSVSQGCGGSSKVNWTQSLEFCQMDLKETLQVPFVRISEGLEFEFHQTCRIDCIADCVWLLLNFQYLLLSEVKFAWGFNFNINQQRGYRETGHSLPISNCWWLLLFAKSSLFLFAPYLIFL